jgi:hypothetical protein
MKCLTINTRNNFDEMMWLARLYIIRKRTFSNITSDAGMRLSVGLAKNFFRPILIFLTDDVEDDGVRFSLKFLDSMVETIFALCVVDARLCSGILIVAATVLKYSIRERSPKSQIKKDRRVLQHRHRRNFSEGTLVKYPTGFDVLDGGDYTIK